MAIILSILLTLFLSTYVKNQSLEIHNLNKNLIAIIETRNCKIKTGNTKIIHPINLTKIEDSIIELKETIENKVNKNSALAKILNQETRKMNNNFDQLKPKRAKRAFDEIGKLWKFIAGSPDADDLKLINQTFNNLIDESNKQIRINKKMEIEIDHILKVTKNNSKNNNKTILGEIDLIILIFNIQLINKELEEILDSIVKTKIKLVENRFLTNKEINMIENMLTEQGMEFGIPEEALQWVQPKIAINKDQLIYIIDVPRLQQGNAKIIKIQPLNINGEKIQTNLEHIVIDGSKVYSTTKPNEAIQEISFLKDLSKENCIRPIIQGLKGKCNFIKARREPKSSRMSSNVILLNNAAANLSNTCGPQNRTLNGNFLIRFQNCSIWVDDEKFESSEATKEENLFFGALQNLDIKRTLIDSNLDVSDLHEMHLETRHELHHIALKQYTQEVSIWTLGGISMTSILFVSLAVALMIIKKRMNITIQNSSQHNTPVTTDPKDYNSLESQKSKTCEDTLFRPPEELHAIKPVHIPKLNITNHTNLDANSALRNLITTSTSTSTSAT
jgi:Gypsy protein